MNEEQREARLLYAAKLLEEAVEILDQHDGLSFAAADVSSAISRIKKYRSEAF